MKNRTHVDLFSGIGGFALACHWAGIETVAFCDNDKFCQSVLKKNFPGVPMHADIKEFHGQKYANPFILTGGFPCQPFSVAGKRRGTEDDRWLWKEMLRVIEESKPRWVIGENVAGIVNMALDEVLFDLESLSYETQAFIIPACAVNAPHRRDRVWIIANHNKTRSGARFNEIQENQSRIQTKSQSEGFARNQYFGRSTIVTDTASPCYGPERRIYKKALDSINTRSAQWDEPWLEAATRLCRVDDGIPGKLDRVNRLKSLGNAIVPQVAYEIINAILQAEDLF